MRELEEVEHSIKQSANAILKSGNELLPVVFALREGLEVYSIGHIPKQAWPEAIWLLAHVPVGKSVTNGKRKMEPTAKLVAFACSMRTRLLEKGEVPEQSPLNDPLAEDGALVLISTSEGLRGWACKYELNSKGQPVNIGEWEELPDAESDLLKGLWE